MKHVLVIRHKTKKWRKLRKNFLHNCISRRQANLSVNV